MPILLTADLHLTDKDEDLYRWDVFNHILEWCENNLYTKDRMVIIAGDLCDRKDRHSAVLVNMIVDVLKEIVDTGTRVIVLLGNHDAPLNGPPYWTVLNSIDGIEFIIEPMRIGNLFLLPYTDNPIEKWVEANVPAKSTKCIIMHQTVTGVLGNNGHELINDKMPAFHSDLLIYSGDIHNPQIVYVPDDASVIYIGAPHPIKFGDTYQCRMLELDDNYEISNVIELHPPAKHMVEVYNFDELDRYPVRDGDQARVRFFTHANDIGSWAEVVEYVKAWASAKGVLLAGVEPVLDGVASTAPGKAPDELLSTPAAILEAFFKEETTGEALRSIGRDILKDVLHGLATACVN